MQTNTRCHSNSGFLPVSSRRIMSSRRLVPPVVAMTLTPPRCLLIWMQIWLTCSASSRVGTMTMAEKHQHPIRNYETFQCGYKPLERREREKWTEEKPRLEMNSVNRNRKVKMEINKEGRFRTSKGFTQRSGRSRISPCMWSFFRSILSRSGMR